MKEKLKSWMAQFKQKTQPFRAKYKKFKKTYYYKIASFVIFIVVIGYVFRAIDWIVYNILVDKFQLSEGTIFKMGLLIPLWFMFVLGIFIYITQRHLVFDDDDD